MGMSGSDVKCFTIGQARITACANCAPIVGYPTASKALKAPLAYQSKAMSPRLGGIHVKVG